MTETEERIVRAIRREEALSVPEIAEALRITRSQARTAVTTLVKSGTLAPAGVSRTGATCYVLAAS